MNVHGGFPSWRLPTSTPSADVKTGRTMIYMAAEPTHSTKIFVGDEEELAEVRWVGLSEADELLPGMFEPVRAYLRAALGAQAPGLSP